MAKAKKPNLQKDHLIFMIFCRPIKLSFSLSPLKLV